MKFTLFTSLLLFCINLQAQDLSAFIKENEALPCFGNSKPIRIAKNVKFANLSTAIPKYYTSIACLVSGNGENIMGLFKIPENIQFLFDKTIFAPEVISGSNESVSKQIESGKSVPIILYLQVPSDINADSAKEIVKSATGKSKVGEELGKLGSLFGKKKNKSLPIPILGEDNKSESRNNKRPIFVNYKVTESPGENVIHLKSERKDKHVNFFELQITFKNNPGSNFQIVNFQLLSDLELYDASLITIANDKKKDSNVNDEIDLQITKSLFENIPKNLSQQMKVQSRINP